MDLHLTYPTYTGSSGVQAPSTLDSSYYDLLTEDKLRSRDEDQVLLKWFIKNNAKRNTDTSYIDRSRRWYRGRQAPTGTELMPRLSAPTKIPTKGDAKAKKEVEPKILMIHQLWLWKLCDSMSANLYCCRVELGDTVQS